MASTRHGEQPLNAEVIEQVALRARPCRRS
jgi:hypothetical protein